MGYDIFAPEYIVVYPHQVIKINTKIKIQLPKGFGAFIKDRSSVASKGIHVLGGVIDNGYRGEIKVLLINTTYKTVEFMRGDAIAQLIIIPLFNFPVEIVEKVDLNSKRKEKGFGSSNDRRNTS